MINNDPHGLILTLIAVSTVFFCLLVLFIAYTLLGKCFTRKPKVKKPDMTSTEITDISTDNDIAAAIAVAIELYRRELTPHEELIFNEQQNSAWSNPCRTFRHNPTIR